MKSVAITVNRPLSLLRLKRIFVLSWLLLFQHCDQDSAPLNSNPTDNVCNNTIAEVESLSIFPRSHPLNLDISTMPIDSRSGATIAFLSNGLDRGLKADFGSGLWNGAPIGIPFTIVCKDQPLVSITFRGNSYDGNYGSESDPGPYPIPLNAPIEGNGVRDSHVIAVNIDDNKLYELYNASTTANGWEASSGAIFDLSKEEYRPDGWTSADAAGLPIFPCLVRYDEVASGVIDHAIRFTISRSKLYPGYVHPARHRVNGTNTNINAPTPLGMRLRLKADFDVSGFSPTNKVILNAMKKYGIILADIGSDFYISGSPDSRWDNDDLQELNNVRPMHFEVVQLDNIKN